MSPTASHQPNVPGRGILASYSAKFWLLVVGVGVFTGLAGAALVELLKLVERLAWFEHEGSLLDAVKGVSDLRQLVVLALAGVIAGVGIAGLRRARRSGAGEISEAIWLHDSHVPLPTSLMRAVLSIVTVGMGASLGREGAPQLAGASAASRGAEWLGLPAWQRRLLVACGAGAGMAAVYDVPLGGALFALEVLLGTITLPLVVPALATTLIATATAWIAVPNHPTYTVPTYAVSASQIVWAVLVGPILGLGAVAWIRAIRAANAAKPTGRATRFLAPVVIFSALGGVSIAYPQLLGNGLDIVQLSLLGKFSIGLLLALLVLKPLATVACLGSGSPGGLFTPSLAVGCLLGGVLGYGWAQLWPGSPLGSYALIGGAGLLGAAMQGPLAAVVLVLELTRTADALIVPVLIATIEATVVARLLRAQSIYSARIGDTDAERQAAVESEWALGDPPPSRPVGTT